MTGFSWPAAARASRPRVLRAARLGGLAVLALAVAGCMPQGATTQGQSIHSLYVLFFAMAALVWALVTGLITWSIIRYRHRGPGPVHDRPLPPQYHGNLILEAIWITLPIITVIGLFIATLGTLNFVQKDPPSPLQVHVTAFQWQWEFQYTGTNVAVIGTTDSIPQFLVPVGQDVHITLTSADVDHSFWVPAFNFKEDAIPGHPNQFDFKVTQAGTFRGQCVEFCGVYHDRMIFDVLAVSPAEFTSWLHSQEAASSPAPASPAPSVGTVTSASPTPAAFSKPSP